MDEEYSKVTMVDQLAIAVSSPKNYKHLTKVKSEQDGRIYDSVLLS